MKQTTGLETAKVWRIPAKYVAQSFPRHTHQRYAIGVIEDGALGFYYRGENVVASKGSINLCIPGEVHTGYSASEAGWAYRMFYFDPKLLQQAASEVADCHSPLPFFQSGVIQDNDLAQCFRRLHIKLEQQETSLLQQESLLIWTLAQMVLRYADDPPVLHKIGKEHLAVAKKLYPKIEICDSLVSCGQQSKSLGEGRFFLDSALPLGFYKSAESLVRWSDSGHFMMNDNPDEFYSRLRTFLSST